MGSIRLTIKLNFENIFKNKEVSYYFSLEISFFCILFIVGLLSLFFII